MRRRKIEVTAHRGASGLAPENTLAAVLLAMKLGADFAEVDVQETADGRIILLHDSTLARTTNQKGKIWTLNYSDLESTDAGFWFSPDFAGEPIPSLEAVIDAVSGKMRLNIELKTNRHQKQLAERVVELVEKKQFEQQCIVTSFNHEEIKKVKSLNPDIQTGLIFNKMPEEDIWSANLEILSAHKKLVNPDFIRKARENGKEIHVWTVNKEKKMREFIELQVDNIITNYPNLLLNILNQK